MKATIDQEMLNKGQIITKLLESTEGSNRNFLIALFSVFFLTTAVGWSFVHGVRRFRTRT